MATKKTQRVTRDSRPDNLATEALQFVKTVSFIGAMDECPETRKEALRLLEETAHRLVRATITLRLLQDLGGTMLTRIQDELNEVKG